MSFSFAVVISPSQENLAHGDVPCRLLIISPAMGKAPSRMGLFKLGSRSVLARDEVRRILRPMIRCSAPIASVKALLKGRHYFVHIRVRSNSPIRLSPFASDFDAEARAA